jgi:hypothetical protein
MNRLSKDIFNVDSKLPEAVLAMTAGLFNLLQFSVYFFQLGKWKLYGPYFIEIFISMTIVYFYMRTIRELARIGN